MTVIEGHSTASNQWKLVSIEELVQRCFSSAEALGQAELYLHDGKWILRHTPCNDMADDHICTVVPKVTRRRDIEVRVLEAMLAEVRS